MTARTRARSVAYRGWRRVPHPVRSTLRQLVGRVSVEDVVPETVRSRQRASGFDTASPETLNGLIRAFRLAAGSGDGDDYFEFGMFRGYTFWFAQQLADHLSLDAMRFHGFDSFAGLPAVEGIDASTDEFAEGDYACSESEVRENLTRWGYHADRTTLTRGFFDQLAVTATGLTVGPVAVALVDCDLYSSTVPALAYLAPHLVDGSVLLFDDWNCYEGDDGKGERRAFREFLEQRPEWVAEHLFDFGWHGHAVRLRPRRATAPETCSGLTP